MSRRTYFDVRHHWFNPLWIRVAIVAALAGWTLFELAGGNVFWAVVFGAATIHLANEFLMDWKPVDPNDDSEENDE